MYCLISPAKSLELEKPLPIKDFSDRHFIKETEELVAIMKKMKAKKIGALMDISQALSELNYNRYQNFSFPINEVNSRPAIYTFDGDVYTGLDAFSLNKKEIDFAQKNLRILSGLYGLLRPLDLMQAYRLEMGISLKNKKGANLYAYWGNKITERINEEMKELGSTDLINLASQEYFNAVKPKLIHGNIIECSFKEKAAQGYKIISFNAKKARGFMARFIIQNNLSKVSDLKGFDTENYLFNTSLSNKTHYVFTRG